MNAAKAVRILLAEADSQYQHPLLQVLTNDRPHVTVTVVGCGAEFLRIIGEQTFDCVVLDFDLKDYQADKLLKMGHNQLRGCPALVICARDNPQWLQSTIGPENADLVLKPDAVNGDELWIRVERAIRLNNENTRKRQRAKRREQHLAKLAETDKVTRLKNRRYFLRCLRQGQWNKHRHHAISCVMVHIDHFDKLNVQYGHDIGDVVLKAIANTITEHCNADQVAVRWGTQQILILKSAAAWLDEWLWAEALRHRIETMVVTADDIPLKVTASIGVGRCRSRDFSWKSVKQADEALSLAKDQGRNVVCTSHMATVARTLNKVAHQTSLTCEERRGELLRQLAHQLGPTQWNHVTNHCEKVSRMAAHIGRLLRMTAGDIDKLRIAGLMHDIGKCVIPEELLAKPRSLSAQEWSLMARHDLYGAWITEKLGVDEQTTRYIQHHHDRFDAPIRIESANGRTVPDGPRVLCVADALVTMLTSRSYRAAMTIKHALNELSRQSGKQFDPDVVNAAQFARGVAQRIAA